jgi:mycothiol synthase
MVERARYPYLPDEDRPELQMVWHVTTPPALPSLPGGYLLRQVRGDEKRAYEELFNLAWPYKDKFDDVSDGALDGGFFVVEDAASGLLVSSCVAFKAGVFKAHPETGSLGWLVTDPQHAGKGLAKGVVVAVMKRLSNEGYGAVYLSTEDERIAAIHIYLKLGWTPVLHTGGMEERWQSIKAALHVV